MSHDRRWDKSTPAEVKDRQQIQIDTYSSNFYHMMELLQYYITKETAARFKAKNLKG